MGDDAFRVQVCHADGALKFPLNSPPKVRPTPRESVCMGVSRSVCGLRVRGEPVLCVSVCVCWALVLQKWTGLGRSTAMQSSEFPGAAQSSQG